MAPKKEEERTAFSMAVEAILGFIKENHLKEGARLPSAEDFCRRYGFSRVIFREAMSYLKGLGVIEAGRGRGMRLCRPDPLGNFTRLLPVLFSLTRNYNDLYRMRRDLELGSVPYIVEQISDEDLQRLDELLQKCDLLIHGEKVSVMEFNEIDRQFHLILAKASGNRLLEQVSECYRTLLNLTEDPDEMATPENIEEFYVTQRSHRMMLKCLKLRNPELCLEAMNDHMKMRVNLDY